MRKAFWFLIASVAVVVMAACKEERKVDKTTLSPDKMATMSTTNVSTLISDSGVVQYKIVAPLWKVYDEVDTPYWIFPKGLYLQKYDRQFKVIATVAADSARYYKNQRLWKLTGHVEMRKMPKDLFLSERLFWDQKRHKIYSDTFMHIETETHTLEGVGFESNEQLTVYRVIKPMGIFPVSKEDITGPAPDQPDTPEVENPADTIPAQQ